MKYLRSRLTGSDIWHNERGQFHRVDGPAIIRDNKSQEWCINDKRYYDNKSFQIASKLTDEDMVVMILKYGNVK